MRRVSFRALFLVTLLSRSSLVASADIVHVENEYVQLFTSPIVSNNATSVTFGQAKGEGQGEGPGSPCWPVVADVNGDGLWDLIVCSETSTNVFVNVGSKGNPQFANCGSDVPAGSMTLVGGRRPRRPAPS